MFLPDKPHTCITKAANFIWLSIRLGHAAACARNIEWGDAPVTQMYCIQIAQHVKCIACNGCLIARRRLRKKKLQRCSTRISAIECQKIFYGGFVVTV